MRLSRVLLLCAFCSPLAGCGGAQQGAQALQDTQTQQAEFQYKKASFVCDRDLPFQKPILPHEQCLDRALGKYITALVAVTGERGNFDLFQATSAERLAIAERFDAGLISVVQYNSEVAQSSALLRTALLQRENNATVAQAARSQASAAYQQAAAASIQAMAASQQARRSNRPQTCYQNFNAITCY